MLITETNDRLTYDPTDVTPLVVIDTYENLFEIKGRSYPEVSSSFYYPVHDYIQRYVRQGSKGLFIVNIALEYCNTSSVKCLLGILKELESRHTEMCQPVLVNWYYDAFDSDNLEIGEDLASCVNLPFNFCEHAVEGEGVLVP